jgi:hypothetical protein
VFVLLDTVLQQLDKCKETPALRGIVGRFMRLYPALEASGALVRLLSEDVEDAVRCGGCNVATQPGCRLPDGKFDSDGVILDGALVVMRAVQNQMGPGGALVLLTDDQYQMNRARGVGLPACTWKEAAARWGGGAREFTAAAAAAVLGVGGGGGDGAAAAEAAPHAAAAATAAPAAAAVRFRLPHKELLEAARTVRALCTLLEGGGGDSGAELTAARGKADVWEAMHAEKVATSSLHSALYTAKRGGGGGGGGGDGGGGGEAPARAVQPPPPLPPPPPPPPPPLPPPARKGPALPVDAVAGGSGYLNRKQRRALLRAAAADAADTGEGWAGGKGDVAAGSVEGAEGGAADAAVRERDEELETLAQMMEALNWQEGDEEEEEEEEAAQAEG